jgi:hypothetical protein
LGVQLSLWLSEDAAPPEVAWEALTVRERLGVVAALARVMAKSISETKEEGDE